VPARPPASALDLSTTEGAISTAAPGQEIVLVGRGFAPYSTVTLVIYSTPRVLGTVVADGDGNFEDPVRVPADLAAGVHTILATGVDPDGNVLSRALTFTLTGSQPSPTPTPPPVVDNPPFGMPKTGQNIALVAGVGLLMIGAGTMMLLVRRRRPGPD
jgi:titin